MGKSFNEIPAFVASWIQKQHMFWVATAPLSETGHINLSPKGFAGTFHIKDEKTVWYEDMTGSGVETIAHLRENGRMTIMLCAFEGPPQIVRLYGYGKVFEYDTPEYNELIPLNKRQPGSRSVIMLHIRKVTTSCGFSIPFYTFKADRMRLHQYLSRGEREDIKAATCQTESEEGATTLQPEFPEKGVKHYWAVVNKTSIDGLPGIQDAYKSKTPFDPNIANKEWKQEKLLEDVVQTKEVGSAMANWVDLKVFVGFLLGVLITGLWSNLTGVVGLKLKAW